MTLWRYTNMFIIIITMVYHSKHQKQNDQMLTKHIYTSVLQKQLD